jgi:hypothetical protein
VLPRFVALVLALVTVIFVPLVADELVVRYHPEVTEKVTEVSPLQP